MEVQKYWNSSHELKKVLEVSHIGCVQDKGMCITKCLRYLLYYEYSFTSYMLMMKYYIQVIVCDHL